MTDCNTYLLSECVDNYMIDRSISKKKYYASYMVMAKKEWQKLFRNTIWSVQTRWLTLKKGEPYCYVDIPPMASRLFSVSVENKKCGLVEPLFYNEQLNVVSKPKVKKCGCPDPNCTCSGVCEAANSMVYTTTLMFTINGIEYFQKCWVETCKNGDIIEYCETPTKKYNNIAGDGGDYYDQDYNNDYLIGNPPFSDFTIEYVKSQKKICKLDVEVCGCPSETDNNAELLTNTCGCNLNWDCGLKKRHCKQYDENINNNHLGEVKISECGTRIFYKPSPNWQRWNEKKYPDFLQLSFQTNGLNLDSAVLVPDYAIDAMETGIHYRSVRFNTSIPKVTRDDAKYENYAECDKLVGFLNPISLVELGKIQDIQIRY